jgi:hypothetical protein
MRIGVEINLILLKLFTPYFGKRIERIKRILILLSHNRACYPRTHKKTQKALLVFFVCLADHGIFRLIEKLDGGEWLRRKLNDLFGLF